MNKRATRFWHCHIIYSVGSVIPFEGLKHRCHRPHGWWFSQPETSMATSGTCELATFDVPPEVTMQLLGGSKNTKSLKWMKFDLKSGFLAVKRIDLHWIIGWLASLVGVHEASTINSEWQWENYHNSMNMLLLTVMVFYRIVMIT